MLNHPTLDQIHQLGLAGMARAFTELDTNPETPGLSHGEWLGLLLDREITARRDKRLTTRLRYCEFSLNPGFAVFSSECSLNPGKLSSIGHLSDN